MKVGVPKEVKVQEHRVAIVPAGVLRLTQAGHQVFVQKGAGLGSGIPDEKFVSAGATMIDSADEVWKVAEMIIKVKEPIREEHERMQAGQTIFTYFHLAAVPELAPVLVDKKITAVAYETVELADGRLPLLQPMSEIAGKMATQVGANLLEKEKGGKGVLLGGVPGVRRGRVVIIGGGVVGTAAAKIAVGLGAMVTILDVSIPRLEYLDDIFGARVNLLHSNPETLTEEVEAADVLIGAVLITGARAPRLVSKERVEAMEDGSVIVDVAVDQGGCIETIHSTTHDAPSYVVGGVIHYGVANMPGAVAHTSTYALTNVTMDYAVALANHGPLEAAKRDKALIPGFNAYGGKITHQAVAEALGMKFSPLPL